MSGLKGLSLKVEGDVYDRLEALAIARGRTKTDVVSQFIDEGLDGITAAAVIREMRDAAVRQERSVRALSDHVSALEGQLGVIAHFISDIYRAQANNK